MPSKYRDLRTPFHISENDARLVYEQRFNSKDAVRLNFQISGNQAFYVMDSDIYEFMSQSSRRWISTRREINDALEMLAEKDKTGRF